jgi:hypothetical protein
MNVALAYYKSFYKLLDKHEVEYLCVGGIAVTLWGYSRSTNDFDLWVNTNPRNTVKLIKTIEEFGFPTDSLKGVTLDETTHPIRLIEEGNIIEILHTLWYKPLSFDMAYSRRRFLGTDEFRLPVIYLDDLIDVKKESVRLKDKEDVRFLEIIKNEFIKRKQDY